MLMTLALRNVRRSLRDYLIYFVTLTLVVALMAAFLALGFSPDVLGLSENMSMLRTGTVIMSMLVALLASFVVGYAIRFMLDGRRREFALYVLMGMERRQVQALFLGEHVVLGMAAFVVGAAMGGVISGVLAQLVMNIFKLPHTYAPMFSLPACGLTFAFFALMMGVGILRGLRIIRRRKIVDLLFDHQKNEKVSPASFTASVIVLMLSLLVLVVGSLLVGMGLRMSSNFGAGVLTGGVVLILLAVYGVHWRLPMLWHRLAQHRKYEGDRLFFLGQIGRRLRSSGRTLAAIAVLFTVSLSTLFVGLAMGGGYRANMEAYYPYDVGVAIDAPLDKESMVQVRDFVDGEHTVTDDVSYYLYTVPDVQLEAMALSDYNHLRSMLGLTPVQLTDDAFSIHCDTWNLLTDIEAAIDAKPQCTIAGQTLTAERTIHTEPMECWQMAGTKGAVLVLPDAVAKQLAPDKIRWVGDLADGGAATLRSALRHFLENDWQPTLQPGQTLPEHVRMGVTVQAWGVENSLTGFTALSFCGLYLSVIFIVLACTVLAFEQLSAISANRRNYTTIDRLGVPDAAQRRLVRREITVTFFIPLGVPLLLLLALTVAAQTFFGEAILQQGLVLASGVATFVLFAGIYLIYYAATLAMFQRLILKPSR